MGKYTLVEKISKGKAKTLGAPRKNRRRLMMNFSESTPVASVATASDTVRNDDTHRISLRTLICFSFSVSTPVTPVTTASDTVRNDDTHRVRSANPIRY
ncbi:hypothetical protein ILUMI_02755 [Ignelater luminosus]|uniref:Uncharacterized protein n=1 Tax=Ignelater luminosus TaxID=2038154 RepID=A0A8K0DCU2_IGNLU|nr:hypothetical protein ILUMI_02755 [Ignelater luminosus]